MNTFDTSHPRPWLSGLGKGELIRFDGRRGQRIANRRGTLWITQDEDPDDVVLGEGEDHRLGRDGPVLVQALDAACVVIESAGRPLRWWERLRGFAPLPVAVGNAT
jgi:hypothetical protein